MILKSCLPQPLLSFGRSRLSEQETAVWYVASGNWQSPQIYREDDVQCKKKKKVDR